ncbi:MAG: hypothetical protein NDJ92_18780, partial [Thermoanaerobaculia bacterium]|nr:hypothetical protein [Thermoanaerobaculia bacterium]
MTSKAGRRHRVEANRPSTFFIVAIVAALLLLVGAFIGFVSKTPGARPASTTTWNAGHGQCRAGTPACAQR